MAAGARSEAAFHRRVRVRVRVWGGMGCWVAWVWFGWWVRAVGAAEVAGVAGVEMPRYVLKHWTTEHGLPQSTPRAILQTRDGYLWVGTFHGLARFDGLHFESFTVGNTPSMRSDSVVSMFEDREGVLWIATDQGLVSHRAGVFASHGPEEGLPAGEVRGVAEDGEGRLWVALADRLFRRVGEGLEELPGAEGTGPRDIGALCLDGEGVLWVGARNGLWRLRPGGVERVSEDPRLDIRRLARRPDGGLWMAPWSGGLAVWSGGNLEWVPEFASLHCSNFTATREGGLWFGSMEGDLVQWKDGRMRRFGRAHGLGGYRATSVAEDREGVLWVGRGASGLYRMRRTGLATVNREQGMISEDVTSLAQEGDGRVLLGTFGGGVVRVDGDRCVPLIPGDAAPRLVTSLLQTADEGLWLGDWSGPPRIWRGGKVVASPFRLPGTRVLYRARDGVFWNGTHAEGLEGWKAGQTIRYSVTNGLSNNQVFSLAEDAEGGLWVGTERGLNRIQAGRVQQHRVRDGLGSDHVRVLVPDPRGTVFAGTLGGLSAWRRGQWRTLTSREGLVNDMVSEMVSDGLGHVWLGTQGGLMRVREELLEAYFEGIQDYIHGWVCGRDDGVATVEFSTGFQRSAMKAQDGRLWFGSGAGAAVVDPGNAPGSESPPPVHIEALFVEDRKVEVGEGLPEVPAGRDRVEIRYTGINLATPGFLKFRRQLVGYEKDWVDVGNERVAHYTKLPPGSYQFRVIARNIDSHWSSTGAMLSFRVLPAWWQTSWFRGLLGVSVVAMAAGIYRRRVNQLENRRRLQEAFSRRLLESQEAERRRIAAELHDSLGQNLAVVKNLALLEQMAGASEGTRGSRAAEIAGAADRALDEVHAISYALRPPELDRLGLAKALAGMVRRAAESSGIQFKVHIDFQGALPEGWDIQLFRIAQEAVNNLVKHSGAANARVELWEDEGGVHLVVADDGRGMGPGPRDPASGGVVPGLGLGLGLSGIEERARLLGAQINWVSQPGLGTTLSVRVGRDRGAASPNS